MNGHLPLPPVLSSKLSDFRRRVWLVKLTEGLLAALTGLAVSYLVVLVLDRFMETPSWLRGTLLALGAAVPGIGLPLSGLLGGFVSSTATVAGVNSFNLNNSGGLTISGGASVSALAGGVVLLGGPNGQASNSTVTVDYAIVGDTATAGLDYVAGSDLLAGTLSFGAGETVKTVRVALLNDATTEASETFGLQLSLLAPPRAVWQVMQLPARAR